LKKVLPRYLFYKQRAAQQAFAADGPSEVFIEGVLCTLSQSFIEGFVAAAEMQALERSLKINLILKYE
jgi:hypothetical protein